MSRLELIAGNFGTGRAEYINFEFHLPKKVRLPVEAIVSVEENGDYLERSFAGFLKGGVGGAVGIGTTAMAIGLFAAPLAAIGAIGLTAAAIGGGLGAWGGSTRKRVLMQVMAADGRGFVAICEEGAPDDIRKAVSVAHAMRMRHREAETTAMTATNRRPSLWEKRHRTPVPAQALSAPSSAALLAAPVVATAAVIAGEATLNAEPNGDGIFTVAGDAITSTAELAGSAAVDAYHATVEAAEDAWTTVRGFLPWSG